MIYIGNQSKFIPYVEVDKLGQTIAVSPVKQAKGVDQGVIIVVATFRLQRWRQDDIQMPTRMSQSEAPILLVGAKEWRIAHRRGIGPGELRAARQSLYR